MTAIELPDPLQHLCPNGIIVNRKLHRAQIVKEYIDTEISTDWQVFNDLPLRIYEWTEGISIYVLVATERPRATQFAACVWTGLWESTQRLVIFEQLLYTAFMRCFIRPRFRATSDFAAMYDALEVRKRCFVRGVRGKRFGHTMQLQTKQDNPTALEWCFHGEEKTENKMKKIERNLQREAKHLALEHLRKRVVYTHIQNSMRDYCIAFVQIGPYLHYGASIRVRHTEQLAHVMRIEYTNALMQRIALGRLLVCPVVSLAQPCKDSEWLTLLKWDRIQSTTRIAPETWITILRMV